MHQPMSMGEIIEDTTGYSPKKYAIGPYLAKGGFAQCYEVVDKQNGNRYAVKVINKSFLTKPKTQAKLKTEIQIHRKLQHNNIVNFVKCFDDKNNVYLIMELCTEKTLLELSNIRKQLTDLEAKYFLRQILDGVNYLHFNGIIHRDLKLANLFLSNNLVIKIGDFGLAAEVVEGQLHRTICGTPNYIAPEILDSKIGHSYEVDIWSIGIILYTLLIGTPPFETPKLTTTYQKICKLDYTFPDSINVSSSAKSLIQSILQIQPDMRPSLQSIAESEFLKRPKGFTNEIPPSLINVMTNAHSNDKHVNANANVNVLKARSSNQQDNPHPSGSSQKYGDVYDGKENDIYKNSMGHQKRRPSTGSVQESKKLSNHNSLAPVHTRSATPPPPPPPPINLPTPTNHESNRSLSESMNAAILIQSQPTLQCSSNSFPVRSSPSPHRAWVAPHNTSGISAPPRQPPPPPPMNNNATTAYVASPPQPILVSPYRPPTPNRSPSNMRSRNPSPVAHNVSRCLNLYTNEKGTSDAAVPRSDNVSCRVRPSPPTPDAEDIALIMKRPCRSDPRNIQTNGNLIDSKPNNSGLDAGRPNLWVSRYINLSEKYGMAYQLSNGHYGVRYNDATHIIWDRVNGLLEYISRESKSAENRIRINVSDAESKSDLTGTHNWTKKWILLKHVTNLFDNPHGKNAVINCSQIPVEQVVDKISSPSTPLAYLRKWHLTKHAIVWKLSTHLIQVSFFDHTELILPSRNSIAWFTDALGKRKCYRLGGPINELPTDVSSRLICVEEILSQLNRK